MTKALLIDDQEYARLELRKMLAAHPDVEVVGEADDLKPARELIARNNYDVLFLDIKLGQHDGFELVPEVPADKPIIFVTGYEQHARRAFDVNAFDYLVKPVRADRLARALTRLSERNRPAVSDPAAPAHDGSPDPAVATATARPSSSPPLDLGGIVPLNAGEHARFVRVMDIAMIVAYQNYSLVHLADGSQEIVRRSLKSWAHGLPKSDFVRVHRTAIVNLAQVTGYEYATPRKIVLRLAHQAQPVAVSRFATAAVKTRLLSRFPHP